MSESIQFGAMLVNLAGGLALFLYGMHRMSEALKTLAGERMKNILARLTTNRFSAAFAGAAVTAVIQSSSITTVLVVGFITAGIMNFQQSIGIILGANVGTTITAQIIAFKVTRAALFFIATGFFTEVFAKQPRIRHMGAMFMGLGMLFFGMELMSQATAPLRSYAPFMAMMQEMQNPLLGALVGAVFTALVQSSSATTGIVIVMASQGLINLETGIALVLGSNVGTCVTAWLSALGKPREAFQAAVAHILFNVGGVILFLGFIPYFADLIRTISPAATELQGAARLAAETPRQIANAHTLFNVISLLIFLGFSNSLAALVLRLVPPRPVAPAPETEPRFLDRMYLDQPAMALDRVRMELARVGEKVLGMIKDSFPTLLVGTEERIHSLQSRDDEVDALTSAIVLYLRSIASSDLVEPHPAYLQQFIAIANDLESIGDVIEIDIAADSLKRLRRGRDMSPETEELLRDIYKALYLTAQLTVAAIADRDLEKARQVKDSQQHFKGLVERARVHLYTQLRGDAPSTLQNYKLESNTLENFKRIHHTLRAICKLILEQDSPEERVSQTDPDAPEPDKPPA